MVIVRQANETDLSFLCALEEESFEPHRRSSRASLLNSIKSARQKVWILEVDGKAVASSIAFLFTNTMRLYSLAVTKAYQDKKLGKYLMNYMLDYAKSRFFNDVTLEVDAQNPRLVNWYEALGFVKTGVLSDFYGEKNDAYKMKLVLIHQKSIMKNVVVVDKPQPWLSKIDNIEVVTAKEYIVLEKYQKAEHLRVFNLCSSYAYQTMGYYVSLLASARKHHIIPNVATIKDFTDSVITRSIGDDVYDEIQRILTKVKTKEFVFDVFFGHCTNKKYEKLARALFQLFESPFIEFEFVKLNTWQLKKATPLAMEDIEFDDRITQFANLFFNQKKYIIKRFRDYKYNLAILVDPTELTPPSCRMALKNFYHAAEHVGFYTEYITKDDYARIPEFDALFIRATTNVNNYTYQFSRYAYAEGLAVIDDPWSILKCANKIYLAETMKKENIKTPKTVLVGKGMDYSRILDELSFPIVLKEPDNAFGLGVFKVENMDDLSKTLNRIFEISEIVLAQEFVKSSFDWRIGILDGEPLFACKYYMAQNHWQIEKWNADRSGCEYGRFETLPLTAVPKEVLKTATRAASAMGDGLYGVDLKEVNGTAYVIEINDNPNVDYRVEDRVLKGQLYKKVMQSLYNRLEKTNQKRLVSGEYKSLD